MNYLSTRGATPATSLSSAITAGLAPDGGLYVPERLPSFSADDFAGLETLADVARVLLSPLFSGDPLAPFLSEICAEAFDFATPLRRLEGGMQVLELFHGPTAAFKDVGARFLSACIRRLHPAGAPPLTVLVATSGDTGAAVASAFHRVAGVRVVILYPDGRVSPRQAHQLGCFGGNVTAYRVAGSFDDCQALVKQALNDRSLQARVALSSANSISLGRLLPQMSYYALAALAHHRRQSRQLDFAIPTGNLGNAMAATLVRAMGLPIGRIVLATNANRTLADFFDTGQYAPRQSIATLANAMDVGAPSNFERLAWLFPDALELRQAFTAVSVTDSDIRKAISQWARRGEIFCPHSATALAALDVPGIRGRDRDWAVVATAHPAKFETIVEPLIGGAVGIPATLAALLHRPSRAEPMPADYGALCYALGSVGAV